jgi:putative Mg2+ transporter-C (MgtC) family protein
LGLLALLIGIIGLLLVKDRLGSYRFLLTLMYLVLFRYASAVAVLAVAKDPDADASRVIQGVIIGVGFLGTGVILRRRTTDQVVHGLSSAATIWITASLGILCGLAAWPIWIIAVVLTAFLLFADGVVERLQGRRLVSAQRDR